MIDFAETARKAASEFGLSMKDDPTLWPAGDESITAEQVRTACNSVAAENARSALSRALGKIAENVATDIDVALAEDGVLADVDGVLAQYVENAPEIDLSSVVAAPDWAARVEVMREAFAVAVAGYDVAPLPIIDLLHYANSDPRLAVPGLRKAIAALRGPEHDMLGVPSSLTIAGADSWDDETEGAAAAAPARERGKPAPGRKRRTKEEIAEDAAADAADTAGGAPAGPDGWDDEPDTTDTPDTEAKDEPDAADSWDDEPAAAASPNFPGLVNAAGVADMEVAEILGVSRGYYSQIRNGKRPWPGLKPDQVKRLRAELNARLEAIAAVEAALSAGDVVKPDGV